MFAIFIETGALYIVFMTIELLGEYEVFDETNGGFTFRLVWSACIMEISVRHFTISTSRRSTHCVIQGIYPTIIIIMVAKFMSQSDLVYTTPNGLNQDSVGHVMSTMRYTPAINTEASSSSADTYAVMNHSFKGGREGAWVGSQDV